MILALTQSPELILAELVQQPLPTPQLVLALTVALGMFIIVIELVRRQKLREEYAFLWMGTAGMLMVLALNVDIMTWLAEMVQAESPSSVLFFGALVFLILVALQFSVRLTKLTYLNKTLSQRIALLERSIEDLQESGDAEPVVTIATPIQSREPEPRPSQPQAEASS